MPRSTLLALACAALVLGLAGCGGDNSGGSSGTTNPNASVTVHALDSLKFDKTSYTAVSTGGEVTIQEIDDGSQTHTLRIDGVSSFRLQVNGKGNADSKSIALKPGNYTIYCDIPGHRAAGMEATLTVT